MAGTDFDSIGDTGGITGSCTPPLWPQVRERGCDNWKVLQISGFQALVRDIARIRVEVTTTTRSPLQSEADPEQSYHSQSGDHCGDDRGYRVTHRTEIGSECFQLLAMLDPGQ